METDNRPNAALINREWFESAARALQRDDLCDVLFSAVTYVLYGDMPEGLNTAAEIVFTMVRPALDSDIAKYRKICARNAANARSGRERAVASGTQSQPMGAITTTTPTTTPTTTTTTTTSISNDEQRNRERFEIYGYFWSVGSADPKAELDAFWDYYESLGWKNNKGAVIVSKLAAARMWRRQFETKTPPNGAAAWFKAAKECAIPNPKVFVSFIGSEISGDKMLVRLGCSAAFFDQIKQATPRLATDLRAIWRGIEPIFEPAG